MNAAFRKSYFDHLGLVNLLETLLKNRTTWSFRTAVTHPGV